MTLRQRLRPRLLSAVVLVSVSIVLVATVRVPVLRAAGWALVAEESIEPADVIVVPEWAEDAGALEAADLVRSGIATRVAVLVKPRGRSTQELIRRGILRANDRVWVTKLLKLLGVEALEEISGPNGGTEAEGEALPSWCDQHRFRSLVVVTTPDHSRRVQRVLHRSMRGHETKVMIRSTHYATFDPNRWWQTRDGTRTEVVELEKLLLDVARHPIS